MHENSNWQNLYEQTEVTLLDIYPHIPIPAALSPDGWAAR